MVTAELIDRETATVELSESSTETLLVIVSGIETDGVLNETPE